MSELSYRKLRAPQEDGAVLIDPPLSQVATLVESNRAKLAEFDRRAGFPSGFRRAARIGHDRSQYPQPEAPLIMAGHQPTLFHPGVWFKNFLLSSIGRHVGGQAVNLIADNDTIRAASVRVPTISSGGPTVIDVPFDAPGEAIPWEERGIAEQTTFRRFPEDVRRVLVPRRSSSSASKGLLVERLWAETAGCIDEHQRRIAETDRELAAKGVTLPAGCSADCTNLGETLACARHRLERQFGLATQEFALSDIDMSRGFFVFVARLLAEHRELHRVHNAALAEYRAVNHIRGHAHPVADLNQDVDWYEMPFWLWTSSQPQRRRAFLRQVGQELELTDRRSIMCRISSASLANPAELWRQIVVQCIKLRPRALITTMYARLVLSDLFIHGIGGAKYDELTDEIIRRFFGIEPPAYMTATATFRLPIERPQVGVLEVCSAARAIRDLRFRPESLIGHPLVADDASLTRELQALAAEKREYVRTHTLRGCSRNVFEGLDRINRSLHERLHPLEAHLRGEQARLIEEARRAQLLGSREFSFVLYPEEYLVPRLLELSKVPA